MNKDHQFPVKKVQTKPVSLPNSEFIQTEQKISYIPEFNGQVNNGMFFAPGNPTFAQICSFSELDNEKI
jgi:hypothetical protein